MYMYDLHVFAACATMYHVCISLMYISVDVVVAMVCPLMLWLA